MIESQPTCIDLMHKTKFRGFLSRESFALHHLTNQVSAQNTLWGKAGCGDRFQNERQVLNVSTAYSGQALQKTILLFSGDGHKNMPVGNCQDYQTVG